MNRVETGCSGFCRQCGREHRLPARPAHQAALALMAELKRQGRIDLHLPPDQADPRFSTGYLYGPALGKMFGVMLARAGDGGTIILRAFSGQYNGVWQLSGWVGPVFDPAVFRRVHDDEEKKIKQLGREIADLAEGTAGRVELLSLRKQMSQQLMAEIHNLYRLRNFAGGQAGLHEIFPPGMGIPTGTGDCCAPKLLQHAAVHNLEPLAMAEFYWGEINRSGSRRSGGFYPSCQAKCQPILGFMLCGLEEGRRR